MQVKIKYDFRDEHGHDYSIDYSVFNGVTNYMGITHDNYIHIIDKDGNNHYISTKYVRDISVINND